MTCKVLSKIMKVVCAVGLALTAYLKWTGKLTNVEMGDICKAWSVVYGVGAGTIDINIILDKFIQKGGTTNGSNECANT